MAINHCGVIPKEIVILYYEFLVACNVLRVRKTIFVFEYKSNYLKRKVAQSQLNVAKYGRLTTIVGFYYWTNFLNLWSSEANFW